MGVIWEHFSHCAKVQPRRMSSIQGVRSLTIQLSVVVGSHSPWNCGTGWTMDDTDHVSVPCECRSNEGLAAAASQKMLAE